MIAKLDREDNAVVSEKKNSKNARGSAADLLVNRPPHAPQAKVPRVIQN